MTALTFLVLKLNKTKTYTKKTHQAFAFHLIFFPFASYLAIECNYLNSSSSCIRFSILLAPQCLYYQPSPQITYSSENIFTRLKLPKYCWPTPDLSRPESLFVFTKWISTLLVRCSSGSIVCLDLKPNFC